MKLTDILGNLDSLFLNKKKPVEATQIFQIHCSCQKYCLGHPVSFGKSLCEKFLLKITPLATKGKRKVQFQDILTEEH